MSRSHGTSTGSGNGTAASEVRDGGRATVGPVPRSTSAAPLREEPPMSFTTLPAPARSGRPPSGTAAPALPFRAHGALLTAGALAWAASIAAVGVNPAYGSTAGA